MGKTLSNANQNQEFIKKVFTPKSVEFSMKYIEEWLDKWQQVIVYDGEYIIE